MNPRLTPTQIDDILAAAEHVDVPAHQLVAAAAEIRATLLAAHGEISLLPDTPRIAGRPPAAPVDPLRRARVVRTALVAAVLTFATLSSAAVAGALPDPIQDPISRVAQLFGVDLPAANAEPAVQSGGTGEPGTRGLGRDGGHADKPTGTASTTDAPPATPVATAATAPEAETITTPEPHGPPEAPGNKPLDNPGIGPPENPSQDKPGNGPPDDPGRGNGNGPPAEPGTGNGNNPDGPGA